MKKRERDRDRQTQTDRQTETERQGQAETDRRTETNTDRQREARFACTLGQSDFHSPHLLLSKWWCSAAGGGGATLGGTFHPVFHPPLFHLLLGKTCSPAGGGGATLGSTFHPVRPVRRLHPLTVRHQAGKLLCENGTQQFTDYQQGKTETSSLQSINKGKWKLAVYRL